MKAIIKCHWKSYLVLGIFILLEVKAFIYCALFFFFLNYIQVSTEMDGTCGERGQQFKIRG